MKNKRNVLIAFILVCCLCLSIGYAALVDDLYIDGKVSVAAPSNDNNDTNDTPIEKEFKDDVYFTDFNIDANKGYVTVNTSKDNDDTDTQPDALLVTIPGDVLTPEKPTISFTTNIINDSTDYGASIVLNGGTGNTSGGGNFSYKVEWTDATQLTNGAMVLAAKGTDANATANKASVTITVTLTTTPDEAIPEESFAVTFTATAVPTIDEKSAPTT